MTKTLDIGHRVELVPMDTHFHEITLALYQQMVGVQPQYVVHSYSAVADTPQRLEAVSASMRVLGGMETATENRLRFPCGAEHLLGVRRLFLESCKVPPDVEPQQRPLQIFDKKSGLQVTVSKLGQRRLPRGRRNRRRARGRGQATQCDRRWPREAGPVSRYRHSGNRLRLRPGPRCLARTVAGQGAQCACRGPGAGAGCGSWRIGSPEPTGIRSYHDDRSKNSHEQPGSACCPR